MGRDTTGPGTADVYDTVTAVINAVAAGEDDSGTMPACQDSVTRDTKVKEEGCRQDTTGRLADTSVRSDDTAAMPVTVPFGWRRQCEGEHVVYYR